MIAGTSKALEMSDLPPDQTFTIKHSVKKLRKLLDFAAGFPYFNLVGFEVLEIEPGRAKCAVSYRKDLTNPDGVMHGGVIATLIDAAFTEAMLMTDEFQKVRDTKGMMSTIDLGVKYLRPCTEGKIFCEADMGHRGRRVAHGRAVVTDDRGKQIALGTCSMIITLGKHEPSE